MRADTDFGEGFRWIEGAPAGSYTVIALVPPMAYFRDPDGNRILLVEETTR